MQAPDGARTSRHVVVMAVPREALGLRGVRGDVGLRSEGPALDLELLGLRVDVLAGGAVGDEDHLLAVDGRGRVRSLEGLHREGLEGLVVEEVDGVLIAIRLDVRPHLLLLVTDLDGRRTRQLRALADRLDLHRGVAEGGDGVLAKRVEEVERVHEEQIAALVDERLVAVHGVALQLFPDALDEVLAVLVLGVEEHAGLAVELGVAERRELRAAGRLVLAVDAPADRVVGAVGDQAANVRGVQLRGHQHRTVGVGEDRHVHELRAAGLGAVDRVEHERDLPVQRADGVPGEVVGIAGLHEEGVGVVDEALVEGTKREDGQHWRTPFLFGSKNRLRAGLPRIPTGNANSRRNMPSIRKLVKY